MKDKLKICCKRIVRGIGQGKILWSKQPINFLGMINVKTGEITDNKQIFEKQNLKGKILIFPNSIGSSVGAYTIFSLKNNNVSPNGIICTNSVDITTASGCAISNIPLAFIDKKACDKLMDHLSSKKSHECEIILNTEKEILIIE